MDAVVAAQRRSMLMVVLGQADNYMEIHTLAAVGRIALGDLLQMYDELSLFLNYFFVTTSFLPGSPCPGGRMLDSAFNGV